MLMGSGVDGSRVEGTGAESGQQRVCEGKGSVKGERRQRIIG